MGVAMRGIDRHVGLSCIGRAVDMPGAEGERLSAAAREHDGAGMEPLHSIRATGQVSAHDHGFVRAGGDGLGEGALKQDLRDHRLGVDVGALAEQDEAGKGEEEREDEAGHRFISSVLASEAKQSIHSFRA